MRGVSVTQRRSREVIWEKCRTGGTNNKRNKVVSEQEAEQGIIFYFAAKARLPVTQ